MALRIHQRFVNTISSRLQWLPKRAILPLSAVIVVIPAITALACSYGPMVSVQPESGTHSGGAITVADANASSGQAVRFGNSSDCAAGTPAAGGWTLPDLCGWPTASSTGPRYECATTLTGRIQTTSDGQVFDNVCINGGLDINHNNVVVRDVAIMGSGLYPLDIGPDSPTCPTNLTIEYTEVDMSNINSNALPIYQRCGGDHSFDHIKVHNCARGMQLIGGGVSVTDSYIYCHRTWEGDHRTAISSHGGTGFTVTHNTFMCVGDNCSSSVNMYSDYAPMTDYLFQDNLVAGGTICVRGGETHVYATQTSSIRVINNRFSTHYNPLCGVYQPFAQFDENAPGNVQSGNVYHESGDPIPSG